ncbi:MAG: hypothetical protein K5884_07985 [Ruminococcus sp.]|nr:hypothetical protein [Ruminococcus sp.]
MKYIVMECHEGYAVLMDEESRFVNAANLGYTVGQTVTEPVLMEYGGDEIRRKRRIVMTVAAAAACLVVMFGTGYHYYAANYKTYSTVIISSDAGVKMHLNKKGKVISLESTSPKGDEILSNYSGKGKDKNDAISDILEMELSKGYITNGDTVSLYISENAENLRKELEKQLNGLSLKADVQPIEDFTKPTETASETTVPQSSEPATEPAKAPAAQPVTENTNAVQPTAPAAPDNDKPAAVPPPPVQEDPTAPSLPSKPGSEEYPTPETPLPEQPQPPTADVPAEKPTAPQKPDGSKIKPPTLPDGRLPHENSDDSQSVPRRNTDKLTQQPDKHILQKPAPHISEPLPPEPESEPQSEPEPLPAPEPVSEPGQTPEPEVFLP